MICLDTHVVVWLYEKQTELMSAKAKKAIEVNDLVISPIVSLELEYLFEAGKISLASQAILRDLESRIGLTVDSQAFLRVSEAAILQTWTRDPFDRIIVGQALAAGCKLLTKDRTILKHCSAAVW